MQHTTPPTPTHDAIPPDNRIDMNSHGRRSRQHNFGGVHCSVNTNSSTGQLPVGALDSSTAFTTPAPKHQNITFTPQHNTTQNGQYNPPSEHSSARGSSISRGVNSSVYALFDVASPPSNKSPPSHFIRKMLKAAYGIDDPRGFQLQAIEDIAFNKKDVFMIVPTGHGKSLVVQGAATILRKVTLVLEPLQGLSSDQVSKTMKLNSRVEAYHTDEMSDADQVKFFERLSKLQKTPHLLQSIVIFASPQSLTQKYWKQVISFMVEHKLLSLFCIDEAHCVVTQGRSFRPEFNSAIQNVLSTVQEFGHRVPILSMTATLNARDQLLLREVLSYEAKPSNNTNKRKRGSGPSYEPGTVIWLKMGKRGTTFRCSVHAQPPTLIKNEATTALKQDKKRKVMVYCNARTNAEGTIHKAMKAAIKDANIEDGVSIPCHGQCGVKKKSYLMHLFSGAITEPNLIAMPGTASMNCGISSNFCSRVWADGPPPSIYDVYQQMGRLDRLLKGILGEHVYHAVLSLPLFMNLFVRVMQTENNNERAILKKDLFEVIRMLVLPTECYHIQLERALEKPSNDQRDPCQNSCSYCTGEFLRDCQPFVKEDLIELLQHVFYDGHVTDAVVLKKLSEPKNKKKLFKVSNASKLPQGKLHAVILQLMASGIIVPIIKDERLIGKKSLSKKDIVWNFGRTAIVDGEKTFNHRLQSSWTGFNCVDSI